MARTKAPVAGETPAAGGSALAGGLETTCVDPVDAGTPEDAIVAFDAADASDIVALDVSGIDPAAVTELSAALPEVTLVRDGERLVYALCLIDDGTTKHAAGSYLALPADEAARLIAIGAALDPDAPAFPHRGAA